MLGHSLNLCSIFILAYLCRQDKFGVKGFVGGLVSSQALKVDGEKKLNGRGSREENLSEDQMWREQRWWLRGLREKEENNGGTSLR